MAKSTFKVSRNFTSNVQRVRDGIHDAATAGMVKMVAVAEEDARKLASWHRPGEYMDVDQGGNVWEWEVTGASAASITGYIVGNKKLKSLNPGPTTTVYKNGAPYPPHAHNVDPSLTEEYTTQPGKVMGVVTMYTAYAPYLQDKEVSGATWGSPAGRGSPVTIEVFEINWDRFYVPVVIRPIMESWMQRVAARLR